MLLLVLIKWFKYIIGFYFRFCYSIWFYFFVLCSYFR